MMNARYLISKGFYSIIDWLTCLVKIQSQRKLDGSERKITKILLRRRPFELLETACDFELNYSSSKKMIYFF